MYPNKVNYTSVYVDIMYKIHCIHCHFKGNLIKPIYKMRAKPSFMLKKIFSEKCLFPDLYQNIDNTAKRVVHKLPIKLIQIYL